MRLQEYIYLRVIIAPKYSHLYVYLFLSYPDSCSKHLCFIHIKVENLLEATRTYMCVVHSHIYLFIRTCHLENSDYPLHLVVLYVSKSREVEIIMERRNVAVVVARQRRCKRARNRIAKKISCKSVNTKIILN